MKVNMGCGKDIRPGWANLDRNEGDGVDVIFDLNTVNVTGKCKTYLPFKNSTVEHILLSHVLEHIWTWEEVMYDCYRILAPGGTVEVRVPFENRGFDSIGHVRFFSKTTMDGMCMVRGQEAVGGGLTEMSYYIKAKRPKVRRGRKESWHIKHYLGLSVKLPCIRWHEIVWVLQKPRPKIGIDECYCSDGL